MGGTISVSSKPDIGSIFAFNILSVHVENLPDIRKKLPIGVRLNYFLGDKVVLRGYYRYYIDDWGLKAHMAELECL